MRRQVLIIIMALSAVFGLLPIELVAAGESPAVVVEETIKEVEEAKAPATMAKSVLALAAALVVGLCALATAWAQSRIGAAGCGSIAERPETMGTVLLLVAIPETMVILGFVVGILILFT